MAGPACSWLEQREADVPAGDQWLSAAESAHLKGLRFSKKRRDWRLGRWTAKQAVASCLNLDHDFPALKDIEIRALPSGAPEVYLFKQATNVRISLSHRAGCGLCAVALSDETLGCDLELVEPRADSFAGDFFTPCEKRFLDQAPADQRPMLITIQWSAKESALKALAVGLRLPTASLEVSITNDLSERKDYEGTVWSPLSVRSRSGRLFKGWWRCDNQMVRTLVFSTFESVAGD